MINGAKTTYVEEGSGPPVLLLHGAPFTSLGFVRVIHELRTTHRVIAPDLPGFGGSETPREFGGTLAEYAHFVEEFCRVLGLKQLVMYVNDSSGAVGIVAAAHLAPGTVSGLIVADTVPIPLTGPVNRRFNVLPWLVVTVAPWLNPFSKYERAALAGEFDTAAKRERVLDLFENMGADKEFMSCTAVRAAESLREVPALILYGQLDPMRLVGGVSRFRAMFSNHRVAIIPKEEHFPILSSGAEVGRTIRAWMTECR
jgi:haloalkane dehalogenase